MVVRQQLDAVRDVFGDNRVEADALSRLVAQGDIRSLIDDVLSDRRNGANPRAEAAAKSQDAASYLTSTVAPKRTALENALRAEARAGRSTTSRASWTTSGPSSPG